MQNRIILLLSIVTAAVVTRGATYAATLSKSRPNIILVMTDDQGKGDLSCLGNEDLRTPNLDQLHAESTRLRDFHVSPTCAPTRSALMSGRHEFKNGVTHTILERERMALGPRTVAEMLRDAGYETGIFGKWHLGDEDAYQPHRRGFDETFIHGAGGIGQAYDCSCADAPPNRRNRYFDCVLRRNGQFVQTKGFCTDVFFQAALGWIRERKDDDRPFFAYISTNAPHGPMIAPEAYKQPFLDAGFDQNTAGRYGMIVNIDDNVGLLLEKMNEWELDENTLLIFMTDNGQASRSAKRHGNRYPLFVAGLKNGKGSPNEGGTRVPAFWRWTGVLEKGRDVDALTAHIDLFPTFADLAGGDIPANQVEGRSVVPLLENPNQEWPDRYLFTHRGRWPKGADPNAHKYQACAVRNERYRLINNEQLYDIAADPGETANVAAKHPEVVREMREAFDQWWEETVPLMANEKSPNASTKPFWEAYQRQVDSVGVPPWSPPTL
ncbi:MAG: arylsulfatase [Planctomycetota bacterium]